MCTRDWSAWRHQTMTDDDFVQVADDPDMIGDLMRWRDEAIEAARTAAALDEAETRYEPEFVVKIVAPLVADDGHKVLHGELTELIGWALKHHGITHGKVSVSYRAAES